MIFYRYRLWLRVFYNRSNPIRAEINIIPEIDLIHHFRHTILSYRMYVYIGTMRSLWYLACVQQNVFFRVEFESTAKTKQKTNIFFPKKNNLSKIYHSSYNLLSNEDNAVYADFRKSRLILTTLLLLHSKSLYFSFY